MWNLICFPDFSSVPNLLIPSPPHLLPSPQAGRPADHTPVTPSGHDAGPLLEVPLPDLDWGPSSGGDLWSQEEPGGSPHPGPATRHVAALKGEEMVSLLWSREVISLCGSAPAVTLERSVQIVCVWGEGDWEIYGPWRFVFLHFSW